MKYHLILFLAAIGLLLFSCDEAEKKSFKYDAVGTPGNILVVMGESLWESAPGDTLRHFLHADYPVLPQKEPRFYTTQIPVSAFSKFSKKSRNILIVKISKEFSKTGVTADYDLWAAPQIVIKIKANDKKQLTELIGKHGNSIISYFEKAEQKRLQSAYKGISNKSLTAKLKNENHIALYIPKHYILDKEKDNFIWIRHETQKISQGIMIWELPYTDTLQFDNNNLLELRDSVTIDNVPGPDEKNSFMTTEKRVLPVFEKTKINGSFAVITRGLWRVEGAFMGGPFVNYAVLDKARNRIVYIDGFVYAGRQEKRRFMREVEAIVSSIRFTPAE